LLNSRCFTSINNSGVLLSAEPPAYSLLGNEVSEDPASYAAKATAWKWLLLLAIIKISISLRSFIEVDHLHYPFILPRRSLDTPR